MQHNHEAKVTVHWLKLPSIHINHTIQIFMIATTTIRTYETLTDMYTEM